MAAAFELVMTPALFGFVGYLLDRALGIVPLFTLVLSISVLVYELWKLWTAYLSESDAELERWRAARNHTGSTRG
ncbi:MAG: AtpZ/AtpI family protein [Acidimicrobiales bacterium]